MRIQLVMLALCWPFVQLRGQEAVELTPATRLRVSASNAGGPVQTGTFRELTDTTLAMVTGRSVLAMPLANVGRVEVSHGRKPGLAGGVVGLVLGGAAGGLLACTANRDDYGVFCAGQNDSKLIVGAALGGAAGAVLGALLFRRERWQAVDLGQTGTGRPVAIPRGGG
jgi:hypothetical protein